MRRWAVVVVLAVALLAGAGLWASQRSSAATTRYLTATVARGTVAQTVAATGNVEPSATLSLAFGGSTASGSGSGSGSGAGGSSSGARSVSSGATTVTSVTAHVGEHVAAGVTLATLDASAAQAQLASAQSQLTSAQARQAAEPAGTSQATLDADAAAVAQAEQQVQSAQASVTATVLKAPVDGIVTAVDISPGLPPTSPAITMQTGNLSIVASVSENDITSLQAGQQAKVTFPALSSTTTGTVGSLPTAANSSSGGGTSAVTFPVTIDLPEPPAHLLPGMTAQISIVVAQRDNVLSVPTSAIQGSSTAPTVQVLVKGKPVSKPVELGLSTNSTTEVIAGLSAGQQVVTGVVNPSTSTPTTGGGGFGGGGLRGGGLGGGGFRGGFGGGGFRGGGNG